MEFGGYLATETHHLITECEMKEFILVITMWGADASGQDHYIGQISLQQPMSESQCEYMIDEKMWNSDYENEYYHMKGHCFPAECSGKETCN